MKHMDNRTTIFAMFNGIRPMARAIDESPSTVAAWKRKGRIPAEKQPQVLAVGLKLGLPITAEHVVFPLGQPHRNLATDVAPQPTDVVCDRTAGLQRKDSAA
jgi:hypothetical protein